MERYLQYKTNHLPIEKRKRLLFNNRNRINSWKLEKINFKNNSLTVEDVTKKYNYVFSVDLITEEGTYLFLRRIGSSINVIEVINYQPYWSGDYMLHVEIPIKFLNVIIKNYGIKAI